MDSTTATVGIVKEWIGIVMLVLTLAMSGLALLKSSRMDKYTIKKEKFVAKTEELSYTEKLEETLSELRTDITSLQSEQKKTNRVIEALKCQIKNYQALISALTRQVQSANLIPIKMEDVKVADCEEVDIE
jgi:peptidoglycan hydrolase CwlO-like protein